MKGKARLVLSASLVLLLILIQPMAGIHGTVYPVGVREGLYMNYVMRYSPNFERVEFLVTGVEDEVVRMNVTLFRTDKTTVNQTISVSLGRVVNTNLTRITVPTNTTQGWETVTEGNSVDVRGDALSAVMRPSPLPSASEVKFLFDRPTNLTGASHLSFQLSLDDRIRGERYFVGLEDDKRASTFYEVNQTGYFDPRTGRTVYEGWENKSTSLAGPASASGQGAAMNFGAVSSFSLAYIGNSTRVMRIREVSFQESVRITHGVDIDYPVFPVIAANLGMKDQIFPDYTQPIDGEEETVHQNTRRQVVSSSTIASQGGVTYVFGRHTWDKQTGILINSWTVSPSHRELELVETNAWVPPDPFSYVAVVVSSSLSSFWNGYGILVTSVVAVWIAGYGFVYIYDKWRRNELREFKQWLPLLFILIVASLVSFFLLQILPRLFG